MFTDKPSLELPDRLLQQYWGYDGFRPYQKVVIEAVLAGHDALVLMATGGGKSLCYQVPALARGGVCLVVSPLIALMDDQVQDLNRRGIAAAAIHSGVSYRRSQQAFHDAANADSFLLYVSPERLLSRSFREALADLPVTLAAIDEAHCLSQWGHDFRPAYLKIAQLRDYFQETPFLALTATATDRVRQDIIQFLGLRAPRIFVSTVRRENLTYTIQPCDGLRQYTLRALQETDGAAIVYCRSRRETGELTRFLAANHMRVAAYHAGMTQEARKQSQDAWMNGTVQTMVATTAFGMGINRQDVRLVLHYHLPEHMEAYYQEAGRAGRDGQPARALCLVQADSIDRLKAQIEIRFPDVAYLRTVYQAVCEYLSLPIGVEPNQYFPFSLETFCARFGFKAGIAVHALKLLEQQGLWTLTDAVSHPPEVRFTASRDELDRLSHSGTTGGAMVLALMRRHGSLFHEDTPIHLPVIARSAGITTAAADQAMRQLQDQGLLVYQPQLVGPQLLFTHRRTESRHLWLDQDWIRQRKEHALALLRGLTHYLYTEACREQTLMAYFGETSGAPCGRCDNCLRARSAPSETREAILQLITQQPGLTLFELRQQLATVSANQIGQALAILTESQWIRKDKEGQFYRL